MKLARYFAWAAFVISLGLAIYTDVDLNIVQGIHYNLFELQLAGCAKGMAMLEVWERTMTDHLTSLLQEGIRQVRLDCLFLVSYTLVLGFVSYDLMVRTSAKGLNNLLRFNLVLAVLAGLLNFIGDGILLADMANYRIGVYFWSIRWLSILKFAFGGWAVAVIVVRLFAGSGRFAGEVRA